MNPSNGETPRAFASMLTRPRFAFDSSAFAQPPFECARTPPSTRTRDDRPCARTAMGPPCPPPRLSASHRFHLATPAKATRACIHARDKAADGVAMKAVNRHVHPRFPALSWHVHDHLHPENKLPSSTFGKLGRLTRFRDGSASQIPDDPFRKRWVNSEGVRGGRRFGSWRARPPSARLFRASIDRRRPSIVSYDCGLLGADPPASRSASSRSTVEAGGTIPPGGWHCSVDWRSASRHRTCKRTCKVSWCALKASVQVHVPGGAS